MGSQRRLKGTKKCISTKNRLRSFRQMKYYEIYEKLYAFVYCIWHIGSETFVMKIIIR